MNMKRTNGFTVIELLVVISIVSVLAAILFPVFGKAKGSAHDSSCIQQLRQIGIVSAMYSADSDDRLPYAVAPSTKFNASFTAAQERGPLFKAAVNLPTIISALAPYRTTNSLWRCAQDRVEPGFLAENEVLPPAWQWKPTYYETVGASYDYDDVTAVLRGGQMRLPSSQAILFCDYPAVHGPATATNLGDRNLLFADTHAQLDTKNLWSTNFVPPASGDWF